MSDEKDNPEGMRVGTRFLVVKFIAGGSFGRLYSGKNMTTKEDVAIKMEKKDVERPQLIFEYTFFKKLRADKEVHIGIPKIYYFGPCGVWSALIMDLLGPSLEKVHENCGLKYSLKTTLLLAIQLMHIFEYFHEKGLIYRDTKPENFLFGLPATDKYCVVHIIDLGLSKEYIDDKGKHIDYIEGKGVTGTVRYMSLNNHYGHEVSRRDDLEAVGYMLVYFLKGELPWMGLKADSTKEKYKQIARVKEKTKPEQLCSDLPKEFARYLTDVKALKFEEKPKYNDYIKSFEKLYQRSGFKKDNVFDFDKHHRQRN